MDALKLIPQSFFEFFARLAPGSVAFAFWLGLFNGGPELRRPLDHGFGGLHLPDGCRWRAPRPR